MSKKTLFCPSPASSAGATSPRAPEYSVTVDEKNEVLMSVHAC
jgi:hypothetical protein